MRKALTYVVVGGLLATALVMMVSSLAAQTSTTDAIRETQRANTVRARQRDETLALMKDCTTPGGKCYERGRRQTAGAVGAIGENNTRAAAAASSCAASLPNPTYARVYRCTVATLRHGGGRAP